MIITLVMVSNPVEALKTFFGLNCDCLNRKHNCDDHTFTSFHLFFRLSMLLSYISSIHTVKPGLSRLVGSGLNGLDKQESG